MSTYMYPNELSTDLEEKVAAGLPGSGTTHLGVYVTTDSVYPSSSGVALCGMSSNRMFVAPLPLQDKVTQLGAKVCGKCSSVAAQIEAGDQRATDRAMKKVLYAIGASMFPVKP